MAVVTKKLLNKLIDKTGLKFSRMILEEFRDMRDLASIRNLENLIDAFYGMKKDELTDAVIDQVLEAVGIKKGSWSALTEAQRLGYYEAGRFITGTEVPFRFAAKFDLGNLRAENWLLERSSQLITNINETQREAIQTYLWHGFH